MRETPFCSWKKENPSPVKIWLKGAILAELVRDLPPAALDAEEANRAVDRIFDAVLGAESRWAVLFYLAEVQERQPIMEILHERMGSLMRDPPKEEAP